MPASPWKSLANLLTVATLTGTLLWRENYWRTHSAVSGPAAAPVPTTMVNDTSLLEQNAGLQKQLVERDAQLNEFAEQLRELKAAVEAAKPPPSPEQLTAQFTGQRGLTFDPPIQFQPAPLPEILEKIQQSITSRLPAADAENRVRAAIAMGMTADPFDYRSAMVSLASLTSGGIFDDASRTLFYREDSSLVRADGRENFISALAQALLRQFPLTSENFLNTANDDAAMAALSLMNGDANSARVRFSITDQMALNLDRAGAPPPTPSTGNAPAYLSEIWKFTQDKGSLFAEAVIGQGGLPALNAAYARPPRSSSEILHPETLYLGGTPFEPVKIDIPATSVDGVDPYYDNVAGEFGTYIILRSWFDVDTATIAAEGWMGDRYLIWPGPESFGDHVFWKSAWSTEQDAKEFFDALRQSLMQRFSIPWRAELDAVPDQFLVHDPRRIIRLQLHPESKTVTLQNSTDPAFAAALAKAYSL